MQFKIYWVERKVEENSPPKLCAFETPPLNDLMRDHTLSRETKLRI